MLTKIFRRLGLLDQEDFGLRELPVSAIHPNPYQPRREYDKANLEELAASIKQHGVLQPIIVRKAEQGYEVVSGERRLRASQLLELEKIPAIVGKFTDGELMEIALLENIQRRNLTNLEEGMGYTRLQDVYHTRNLERLSEKIADRMGKNKAEVKNRLELVTYPPLLQKAVEKGLISNEQAALLHDVDKGLQTLLLTRVIRSSVSPKKIKQWMQDVEVEQELKDHCVVDFCKFVEDAVEVLNEIGCEVVTQKQKKKGSLTLTIEIQESLSLEKNDGESEKEKSG